MSSIELNGQVFELEISYKARKTLKLKLIPPNKINITAPLHLKESTIRDLIKKKGKWIIKKLNESNVHKAISKEIKDGGTLSYLGIPYTLCITTKPNEDKVHITSADRKIKIITPRFDQRLFLNVLEQWYRYKARSYITEKVDYYKHLIGREPNGIRIKNQKTRWGSCSNKNNLNFNWRLMMAPVEVINYVIIHELCHLVQLNHSRDFWKLVEDIMPDYKLHKEWLRKNGKLLNWPPTE